MTTNYHAREIIPSSSWSDIVINGVSKADSYWWESRGIYLEIIRDIRAKNQGHGDRQIIVGEKNIDDNINESYNNERAGRGTGESKIFYRKRTIPKKKSKRWPTKPKTDSQSDKYNGIREKNQLI